MRTLLALIALISLTMPAMAADYASQISAYRRAHGLSAVKIDARLNAVALQQARAMDVELVGDAAPRQHD